MEKVKLASSKLFLISSIIFTFLYFPLWWYSLGFFNFLKRIYFFWLERAYALGVWVWLKNIFVPMYGQSDTAGRLISFGIRVVQIIFRTIVLFLWLFLCLLLIFLWLAMPLLILWANYEHFFN